MSLITGYDEEGLNTPKAEALWSIVFSKGSIHPSPACLCKLVPTSLKR